MGNDHAMVRHTTCYRADGACTGIICAVAEPALLNVLSIVPLSSVARSESWHLMEYCKLVAGDALLRKSTSEGVKVMHSGVVLCPMCNFMLGCTLELERFWVYSVYSIERMNTYRKCRVVSK